MVGKKVIISNYVYYNAKGKLIKGSYTNQTVEIEMEYTINGTTWYASNRWGEVLIHFKPTDIRIILLGELDNTVKPL